MAARAWFTKDNTADLTDEDLSILNRAGRVMADEGWMPTYATLSHLRQTYRSGMSARDVADVVIEQISWGQTTEGPDMSQVSRS